jgi:hypothetical protein
MLAICFREKLVYRVASVLDAELELATLPKGFGLWLFSLGHRPVQVTQIQGRKAIIQARTHLKEVSL